MRGRNKLLFALALGLTAGACQSVPVVPTLPPSAADEPPASGSWRATATDQDKERIRGWYSSWEAALADARAKGHGADVDREGVLLQPMAALPNAHLPAGDYRCRTIKVGAKGRGGLTHAPRQATSASRNANVTAWRMSRRSTAGSRPSG